MTGRIGGLYRTRQQGDTLPSPSLSIRIVILAGAVILYSDQNPDVPTAVLLLPISILNAPNATRCISEGRKVLLVSAFSSCFQESPRGRTVGHVSCWTCQGAVESGGTYVVAARLLVLVKLRALLVDTRAVVGRVTTECNIEVVQELVAASKEGLGCVGVSIDTRLSVKDNDTIGKIGGHDEIVLDNKGRLFGVHDESLDDSRGNDTLLGIEIGRRFINQVDIGGHTQGEDNGNTLQFTTGQVLDFLVDKVFELEGLDNIGLELRRQESLLDLLEEELTNSTLELGGDGLGLHADSHIGYVGLAVGLESASQESTKGSLSSTILTHHDDNLRVGEVTGVDAELEVTKSLLHRGVLESTGLVNGELFDGLGDAEGQGLLTESQVLGGNVTVEEDVDTLTNRVG